MGTCATPQSTHPIPQHARMVGWGQKLSNGVAKRIYLVNPGGKVVYNYREMEAPNNFPCWDLCPGSAMCAHGEQGGLRAVPQAMSCFLQLGHPWPVSQPLRGLCLSHFPLPIWGPSSPPGHPTMDLLLQAHPHVVSLCLLPPQVWSSWIVLQGFTHGWAAPSP